MASREGQSRARSCFTDAIGSGADRRVPIGPITCAREADRGTREALGHAADRHGWQVNLALGRLEMILGCGCGAIISPSTDKASTWRFPVLCNDPRKGMTNLTRCKRVHPC